jgi:tetratricopeptide (TPR) repeat protein
MMMHSFFAVTLLLLGVTHSGIAQSSRLGSITFPTSGTPTEQEHFVRGVLFLHSFEYDSAAVEFREAQRIAPSFALAYWGEAMTYNHPVWDQQDQAAALAALARLARSPAERALKAPTDREKKWLSAVEVLYGAGTKAERDTLYERVMEAIAHEWPDDLEAQTFYALSLLGLSRTTRVVPTYMRAGAIALDAFARNPDHPGAAHYAIHAFDDPIHAPLGLTAARAYSRIAPGAAHAQHMTTHIFLALGMWNEVVGQNVIASRPDTMRWRPGHYTIWMEYGLLQQGRFRRAKGYVDLMERNMTRADPAAQLANLRLMRDQYVINAEQWSEPNQQPDIAGANPLLAAVHRFTAGYAALKRRDLTQAGVQADSLTKLAQSIGLPATRILELELSGAIAVATGDTAHGLGSLRRATAIEDTLPMEFGPPLIVKPTHELLGEIYLELGQPLQAQRDFERALALAPRRMRSLLGLARSATLAGNIQVANAAWDDLSDVLSLADRSLPEMAIPDLARRVTH